MTSPPSAKVCIRRLINLKKSYRDRDEFFKLWNRIRDDLFRTPEYQEFRNLVRSRSHNMCVGRGCSRRGRHVHHIIRVYDDPALSLDVANGAYLCIRCHKKEHKGKLSTVESKNQPPLAMTN